MGADVLTGCEDSGALLFGTGMDQHTIHRGRLIGHGEGVELYIILDNITDNHAGFILDDHSEYDAVIFIIRIVDVVGVGGEDPISLIDQDFEGENELGFVIGQQVPIVLDAGDHDVAVIVRVAGGGGPGGKVSVKISDYGFPSFSLFCGLRYTCNGAFAWIS